MSEKILNIAGRAVEELDKLALGIANGHVFTDRHFHNEADARMLGNVFMPLLLGGLSGYPSEELDKIGLIYEWLDKAGPRAINGYPMFLSFQYLNKSDTELVFKKVTAIKEAQQAALKGVTS